MSGFLENKKLESAQNVNLRTSTGHARKKLTHAEAKKFFTYRDGKLFWKVRRAGTVIGKEFGNITEKGYVRAYVNGKKYYVHRVVWLLHNGYLPENDLDHINRNRQDNRIENLREVSRTCNIQNAGNREDNTSGVKGVHWLKNIGLWHACIQFMGKRLSVGNHATFIEAACHRLAIEQALSWGRCDKETPAFKYVKKYIPHIKCG